MPIVIDSNLLVSMVSGDPRGSIVENYFLNWINSGIDLHSPELARYEVANALTRLIVGSAFPVNRVKDALLNLSVLPITYHTSLDYEDIINISLKLKRQSAYDASYLSLTQQLGADLYTLDGPLYRNAIGYGFKVFLIS